MKHKKRHLSGERVNHNVFFDKLRFFVVTSLPLLSQRLFFLSFFSVIFIKTHRNYKIQKSLVLLFDSRKFYIQINTFALCVGVIFGLRKNTELFFRYMDPYRLISKVCQKNKYVNGFMMIIVS